MLQIHSGGLDANVTIVQNEIAVQANPAAATTLGQKVKALLMQRQTPDAALMGIVFAISLAVFVLILCVGMSCLNRAGFHILPEMPSVHSHADHVEAGCPQMGLWMVGYEKWYQFGNISWAAFKYEPDARTFFNSFNPSITPRILFDDQHKEISAKGYNPYSTDNIRFYSRRDGDSLPVPDKWNVAINHGGADQTFFPFASRQDAEHFYISFRVLPRLILDPEGHEVAAADSGLDLRTLGPIRQRASPDFEQRQRLRVCC